MSPRQSIPQRQNESEAVHMDRELEELIEQMREANRVAFAMALRHEDRIKEHDEWLRENELALARHREFLAQHEAMLVALDAKLNAIADLILKGHTGNGSGG